MLFKGGGFAGAAAAAAARQTVVNPELRKPALGDSIKVCPTP